MSTYGKSGKTVLVLLVICALFFIPSCGKKGPSKPSVQGKAMKSPDVIFKLGVEPQGYTLPVVSEISWAFFQQQGSEDLICKLKLQISYPKDLKCYANVNLLDLNNFPVTSQQIKLDGLAKEESTEEMVIYISPDMSKRITKARIEIEPI